MNGRSCQKVTFVKITRYQRIPFDFLSTGTRRDYVVTNKIKGNPLKTSNFNERNFFSTSTIHIKF